MILNKVQYRKAHVGFTPMILNIEPSFHNTHELTWLIYVYINPIRTQVKICDLFGKSCICHMVFIVCICYYTIVYFLTHCHFHIKVPFDILICHHTVQEIVISMQVKSSVGYQWILKYLHHPHVCFTSYLLHNTVKTNQHKQDYIINLKCD